MLQPFGKPSLIVYLRCLRLVEKVFDPSQAYGNLFAMTGSERYYSFSFVRYIFMTPERCEYLNTTCEVLVCNLRAYYD